MDDDPPRRMWGLLLDRRFGSIFWGKFISSNGIWIHGVTAAIAIFAATGSTSAVALVATAQFAPQLLTPWSGSWSDRGWERFQLISGRVLCTLGSAICAVAMIFWGDGGWGTATPIVIGTAAVGIGFAVGGPSQQAVIPRLVRPCELPTAIAMNTAPLTMARIMGPGAGALIAAQCGAAAAFLVATVCHAVFTVILVLVRIPRGAASGKDDDSSIRHALSYLRHRRPLVFALLAVMASGIGAEPTLTTAPALADELHGGAYLVSALSIAFGVGSAIGLMILGVVVRRTSQEWATTAGLVVMVVGLGITAALPMVAAALGGFTLVGAGFVMTLTAATSLIQERIPDNLRGRIMAFWLLSFVGARPVTALCIGPLADATSPGVAIGAVAGMLAVAAVACQPRRLRPAASSSDLGTSSASR